jgi:hypothetical protein
MNPARFLLCASLALTCLPACNIAGFGDSKDEKSKRATDDDDDDDDRKKKRKKERDKQKDKEKGNESKAKADKSGTPAESKQRTRIAELFGVDGGSTDLVPIEMGVDGVQMSRSKAWRSDPYPDFASADNSAFPKEQLARCYLSSRIQPGNVMPGIKLWADSAGARPASWTGPEAIKIGPDQIAADLYFGKDGVEVGAVGQTRPGMTVAMVFKAYPDLVLIGITREDAPVEMKRDLVGCLESFSKKK